MSRGLNDDTNLQKAGVGAGRLTLTSSVRGIKIPEFSSCDSLAEFPSAVRRSVFEGLRTVERVMAQVANLVRDGEPAAAVQ